MELEKILPNCITEPIALLNSSKLYELRIRSGMPVVVNYGGKFWYLNNKGISDNSVGAVVVNQKTVDSIVFKASDCSIYAVNDQIKQGFIAVEGGIRIGLAGEVVNENGAVRTVKNIFSLNIRIPHEVKNCSLPAFSHIVNGRIANTLVISPPGAGKTTFLRDLCRQFSLVTPILSVLVIDERGEIGSLVDGTPRLDIGGHTDIISNCSKAFGFDAAIRTMRPDVIVTDELSAKEDIEAAERAISCGVKIAASTHAYDHIDLTIKSGFDSLIKKRLFNRFVVLSSRRGAGTLEGVFDENFNPLVLC